MNNGGGGSSALINRMINVLFEETDSNMKIRRQRGYADFTVRRGRGTEKTCRLINRLRWQLIADHNEWPNTYTVIRRFLFELVDVTSYHWIETAEK